MKTASGNSTSANVIEASNTAWHQVCQTLANEPFLVICNASANYPAQQLQSQLNKILPDSCKVAATSSCQGVMDNKGFHSKNSTGLSLFAFSDDQGDFGVGLASQGDNPASAAATAVTQAINNAERPGELPALVWINAAPGNEEQVLNGISSVVGKQVPIIGGSSADNTISGDWWQFSRELDERDGVLVIAMYPECHVGFSFQSGYAPTDHNGVVTEARGRVIQKIDGQPAAEVYNRWTDGLIDSQITGGNILQSSTFLPLGIEAGNIENIPYYALKHPEHVSEDGSMSLFANITKGDEITLMEGSPDSLTRRAGTVVDGILQRHAWDKNQLAGSLIVYCAGCMLGVNDRMNEVSSSIDEALGGSPFNGVFTFGEQGCFIDGVNRHANLMISAVIFAN